MRANRRQARVAAGRQPAAAGLRGVAGVPQPAQDDEDEDPPPGTRGSTPTLQGDSEEETTSHSDDEGIVGGSDDPPSPSSGTSGSSNSSNPSNSSGSSSSHTWTGSSRGSPTPSDSDSSSSSNSSASSTSSSNSSNSSNSSSSSDTPMQRTRRNPLIDPLNASTALIRNLQTRNQILEGDVMREHAVAATASERLEREQFRTQIWWRAFQAAISLIVLYAWWCWYNSPSMTYIRKRECEKLGLDKDECWR